MQSNAKHDGSASIPPIHHYLLVHHTLWYHVKIASMLLKNVRRTEALSLIRIAKLWQDHTQWGPWMQGWHGNFENYKQKLFHLVWSTVTTYHQNQLHLQTCDLLGQPVFFALRI